MSVPRIQALAAGISLASLFVLFMGIVPWASFRVSFHCMSLLAMSWLCVAGYIEASVLALHVPKLRERLFVVQKDFFARVPLFNEMVR